MSYEIKPLPYIACAYHGCRTGSEVKVRKPTGWAQLCLSHYASDNDQGSRDYCAKHGLDTVEQKIAHCKRLFKAPRDPRAWMKNPKSEIAQQWADEILRHQAPQREPGQDDEERDAA